MAALPSVANIGERNLPDLPKRLLDVIEQDIIPLTAAGVRAGNKVFWCGHSTKIGLRAGCCRNEFRAGKSALAWRDLDFECVLQPARW